MKTLDWGPAAGRPLGRVLWTLDAFRRRVAPSRPLAVFLFAVLLGRALVLGELSPFGLAFWAASLILWPEWAHVAFAGWMLGAALSPVPHVPAAAVAAGLYGLMYRFSRRVGLPAAYTPLVVAVAQGGAAIVWRKLFFPLSPYAWAMSAAEALLAFVLFIIFVQSFPLLFNRRLWSGLRQEELIALFIVIATLLSGTMGFSLFGLDVHAVLSRAVVFTLAAVGGGAFGATAGVLSGFLLGLAESRELVEMSALGLAGLIAGLFRPAGRFAAAFGGLLGLALIAVYAPGTKELGSVLLEALLGAGLFLAVPEGSLETLRRMIPGTRAHLRDQEARWANVRRALETRFGGFAEMFATLAQPFDPVGEESPADPREAAVRRVAEAICGKCWKKDVCWGKYGEETASGLRAVLERLDGDKAPAWRFGRIWADRCIKPDQLERALEREYSREKEALQATARLRAARRLLRDQLLGLARVMEEMAAEIRRDGPLSRHREANLLRAVEQAGLWVQSMEAQNLVPGEVAVELVVAADGFRAVRELEALFQSLLGERIVVERVEPVPGGHLIRLVSGARYRVHFGYAQAAKGGGLISGDSAVGLDLGRQAFALVLSDGMGSGEHARRESRAAVEMLRAILAAGFDGAVAVRSVNALLSLRGLDERFATVDLAFVDRMSGRAKFIKVGAAPSYIRRGDAVIRVEAQNPPAGVFPEAEFDAVEVSLRPGDVVVMLTDGAYEAKRHPEQRERWIRRLIREIDADEPQAFADLLLDAIVHETEFSLSDDITVAVMTLEEEGGAWANARPAEGARIA
ncbi:MAG: stage II sporulation protein E [Hydrogenibacillus schlegelii]|nr:stage II sporulation protein E [Hydrogenibacillus schlegelii]